MSEYQYFEFQAIDRPLTDKEQEEVREISTRAKITATSFVNEYDYGEFKGDVVEMMEKYYDAFYYYTGFGVRNLMLRVPKAAVDWETISQYCVTDSLLVYSRGQNLIFEFLYEPFDWEEWEDWHLSSFISLRSDLLNGDYRCLYLGWLYGVETQIIPDDQPEPLIPEGLGDLNGSLNALVKFFDLDKKLVKVASSNSSSKPAEIDEKRLLSWIKSLSTSEKDNILFKSLKAGDKSSIYELLNRFKKETAGKTSTASQKLRFAGELRKEAGLG